MKSILLSSLLFFGAWMGPVTAPAADVAEELLIVFDSIERSVEASGSFTYSIGATDFPDGIGAINCDVVPVTVAFDYLNDLALETEGLTQETLDKGLANLLVLFAVEDVTRCTGSSSSRYYDSEYTLFSNRHFSILFEYSREN